MTKNLDMSDGWGLGGEDEEYLDRAQGKSEGKAPGDVHGVS